MLFLRQIWLHPVAFGSFWIPFLGHALFFGWVNRFWELRDEISTGVAVLSKVPMFSHFEVEIPKQLGMAIFAYLPITDVLAALVGSLFLIIVLEIYSLFPAAVLRQVQYIYLPAFLWVWNFAIGYLNMFSFYMGMACEPIPLTCAEVAKRFGGVLQEFPGLATGSLLFGAYSAVIFSVIFFVLQTLCLLMRKKPNFAGVKQLP